jgi:hypothetical protein
MLVHPQAYGVSGRPSLIINASLSASQSAGQCRTSSSSWLESMSLFYWLSCASMGCASSGGEFNWTSDSEGTSSFSFVVLTVTRGVFFEIRRTHKIFDCALNLSTA